LIRLFYLAIGALCLYVQSAWAQSSFTNGPTPWPELPTLPKTKQEWVSNDLRINGIPAKIQKFESNLSKAEVVAFFSAHWRTSKVPVKVGETVASVTQKGEDTLVGIGHGPFYNLVTVKSVGLDKSEGTISTTQVFGAKVGFDSSGVPHPERAKAINVVEAIDSGKRNKQVLFHTTDSFVSVAEYYQSVLTRTGWKLIQEQASMPGEKLGKALVRMYARDREQFDVAIGLAPSGGTVINANLVTIKD
jgi:hypothetical protein